jgi:hypothetical protein
MAPIDGVKDARRLRARFRQRTWRAAPLWLLAFKKLHWILQLKTAEELISKTAAAAP